MSENKQTVLIMTSVEAERQAVLAGIGMKEGFHVEIAGVGPVAASVATTKALHTNHYQFVINMGIAGGFVEKADIGSLVIADESIALDLGAEAEDGFLTLDELGFGASVVAKTEHSVAKALLARCQQAQLKSCIAPILTLSTVTGTEETAQRLQIRAPRAAAEAMEGYGVAMAAQTFNVPFLEIRAISNPVGPRDRSSWKIKEALQSLQEVSKYLVEVL
ncbi:hypothetical protein A374_05691 [Fictibacillus macauensis ZFHKF-1]|uniref:Futalosine hydrolase n=1 Tax=Fictibacillus macauensis ZFHKF-1 TaxID=1196324 RepID=I8UHP3_9BACL|nr:futalosine hydrolase [Fictibacillus macauensis]EIT86430.1 hypothetical protein A374_05691 [Fictibacillus macauensis ZFHKF-1]